MRGALAIAIVAACAKQPPPDCSDAPDDCRAACSYGAGDQASLTLADFPSHIPIDHIVLVMQENRTFDHYFSSLTVPGQTVDGAAPDATNPDPSTPGGTVARFHQTAACFDNPAETWNDVHREVNGGALDGFTTQNALDDATNDPTGKRTMGYYDESDLPYYYALARAFSISDRHFSSVQANSWTNRTFYMAGTSFGIVSNIFPTQDDGTGKIPPNLFTRLNDAGISWAFYVQDLPSVAILADTWAKNQKKVLPFQQYFDDAAAGTLPSVTFVEGSDMQAGISPDEDPPADFEVGQAMVASIVTALTASPQWSSSALFLSYDEQGGFYDHVVPPMACAPDDYTPQIGPTDAQGAFDQYGLRVPLIVVSPYAKRGFVSHHVTDHTSILRFVEARFGLPALTHRDANAVPPFDMFDFTQQDLSVPSLPVATIDATKQADCAAGFPSHAGD